MGLKKFFFFFFFSFSFFKKKKKDGSNFPIWKAQVQMPTNQLVEYKYLLKNMREIFIYENRENRKMKLDENSRTKIHDIWVKYFHFILFIFNLFLFLFLF